MQIRMLRKAEAEMQRSRICNAVMRIHRKVLGML